MARRSVLAYELRSERGKKEFERTARRLDITVEELNRRRNNLTDYERAVLNRHGARYVKTEPVRRQRERVAEERQRTARESRPSFRMPSAVSRNRGQRDAWTKARDEFKGRALDGMSVAQYRRDNGEDALREQLWSARELLRQYERWLPAAAIKSTGEPEISPSDFADWAEEEGPDVVSEAIDEMNAMRDARIAGTPLPGTAYKQQIADDFNRYNYSPRRYNRFR